MSISFVNAVFLIIFALHRYVNLYIKLLSATYLLKKMQLHRHNRQAIHSLGKEKVNVAQSNMKTAII